MNEQTRQVYACIDGSRSTRAVTHYAVWAARSLGAPLTFLHVIDNPHAPSQTDLSGNMGLGTRERLLEQMVELEEQRGKVERERGRAILAEAAESARNQGLAEPLELLRNGNVTEIILELEDNTRLLVLGKQGKDGEMVTLHVGSHLENILRLIHRPVLVTPLEFRKPESFLIAYDGSPTAYRLVERVSQSPFVKGLPAHVLMIGEDEQRNWEKLHSARTELAKNGFEVNVAIRPGKVDEAITLYIEEKGIDLLAMGAYGHSRIRQLVLGSTTTRMIMKAQVPLLILR
ncbi:MAG: universal stress protein [Halothiobacillaceae bacterium]